MNKSLAKLLMENTKTYSPKKLNALRQYVFHYQECLHNELEVLKVIKEGMGRSYYSKPIQLLYNFIEDKEVEQKDLEDILTRFNVPQ